jgi:hypothetical protein
MSRPNFSIDDRKLIQKKGGAKQEQSIVRSNSLKEYDVQGNEIWTRGHSVAGKQSPVSYAQNPDQT